NPRGLNELGWHHDGGNVLRFLADPRIEPTNNRAERALRPAVIGRKVSQCTRTARGSRAFDGGGGGGGARARRALGGGTSVVRALPRPMTGPDLLDAIARLMQPIA